MFERPSDTSLNISHPLATGLQFLYLCNGHKLTQDLVNPGQVGVEVGTALGTKDVPVLGRSLSSTSGAISGLKFLNRPAGIRSNITFFAIVQPTNIAASNACIGADSTDSGGWRWHLGAPSGNMSLFKTGDSASSQSTGLGIVADAPYFVAVSRDGGTSARYLAMRLDSGYLTTSVVSCTKTSAASDGGFIVAGARLSGIAGGFPGAIAMFGITTQTLSLAQLLSFASDPWGIVTPKRRAAGFFAKRVATSNIPGRATIIRQAVNRASTF